MVWLRLYPIKFLLNTLHPEIQEMIYAYLGQSFLSIYKYQTDPIKMSSYLRGTLNHLSSDKLCCRDIFIYFC